MDQFLKNILEFNRQLTPAGLFISDLKRLKKERLPAGRQGYDSVVVAGMGGSGLAGEILKDMAAEVGLKVPVFTWKEYGLPGSRLFGGKRPLYIFVSFSGGTEETLSGFRLAVKKNQAHTAALAHGGELARLARRAGTALVLFPAADLNPRQYIGRMFYGLTQVLLAAGLIPSGPKTYTRLRPDDFKAKGADLAKRLRNKVVLLYTDRGNYGLGYVWKAKLNETAKQLAFLNLVPEMNHNELTGLVFPKTKLAALFISDASGPDAAVGTGRMRKRVRTNLRFLRRQGISAEQVSLTGKSRLERTWNSTMLADWTAYYLARLNRVDPAENKAVEELKKLMRKI